MSAGSGVTGSTPATSGAGGPGGPTDALSTSTIMSSDGVVTGGIPIATLTATAAARGLHSLAADPNYHLRQIFILAVQVISPRLFVYPITQ